eukprot:1460308-Rhodomonas_salina.2
MQHITSWLQQLPVDAHPPPQHPFQHPSTTASAALDPTLQFTALWPSMSYKCEGGSGVWYSSVSRQSVWQHMQLGGSPHQHHIQRFKSTSKQKQVNLLDSVERLEVCVCVMPSGNQQQTPDFEAGSHEIPANQSSPDKPFSKQHRGDGSVFSVPLHSPAKEHIPGCADTPGSTASGASTEAGTGTAMYAEFETWHCLGIQLRELAQSGEPHIVMSKSKGDIDMKVPLAMYAGLEMAAFVSGYKKCLDSRSRPD